MTRTTSPSERPMKPSRSTRLAALAASAAGLLILAAGPADAGPSGKGLYQQNCAYCHGGSGKGDGPNAAKLRPKPADLAAASLSQKEIEGVVRNGKRSCPSWGESLKEDEIAAVAAYVKSLQR